MKKVRAIIERGNDGLFSVYVVDETTYGFNGFGDTAEDAKKDFLDAYNEFRKNGWCKDELEFEYLYDTSSFLQLFKDKLSLAGLQTITGINRKQLNHYVTGVSKPSAKTINKIRKGIAEFQKELSHVQLI